MKKSPKYKKPTLSKVLGVWTHQMMYLVRLENRYLNYLIADSNSVLYVFCILQLPLILGGIAVFFILMGLLQHHTSVNFRDVHEGMVNVQKRIWNIAKDPMSRNSDFSSPSSEDSSLSVYEDAIASKNEPRIKKLIIIEETWNEPGLLNIANFRWIMNNESICKPDPTVPTSKILPVLIHTNRDHFSVRRAIRKSWGSIPIYKNWDVRLIFLLGEPDREKTAKEIAELEEPNDEEEVDNPDYNNSEDETEQEKLHEEQHEFGDLVIGSFRDSFHNLTYKHMMGYKWILNYCPQATFVMKVDEDKFVDIIQWIDWRTRDLEILETEQKNANNADVDIMDDDLEESPSKVPDLYCNVFVGGKPERQVGTTYYASPEDWPETTYPDYCSGWAYATTMELIKMQYSVLHDRKLFWIDDVFLGALLELVNVKYDWKPKVDDCFKTYLGIEEKFRNVCGSDGKINFEEKKEFGAVVHLNREDGFDRDMMCLWNKTVHDIGHKFDF